jgi:hypothetical protein
MVGKRLVRFWVDLDFIADSDPTLRFIPEHTLAPIR